MKHVALSALLAFLLVAGCVYESPLTKEHNLAVDPAVLGLWESIPDKGDEPDEQERMMILKFSDTEYLIHYPVGKDDMYFRGYPVKIGGVSCVQLELLGSEKGPLKSDETDLYQVVSYELMDGKLEIKTLNSDLVDDDLKTTDSLVKSFLKHKDNKKLFAEPGRFRRVKK